MSSCRCCPPETYPTDSYDQAQAHELMGICIEEGRKSHDDGEVPVGCAFVNRHTKQILACTSNASNVDKNACRHAELIAYELILARVGAEEWSRLAGLIDVWVTCEPCVMCAAALKTIGITRCIYGCSNPRFGGCGTAINIAPLLTGGGSGGGSVSGGGVSGGGSVSGGGGSGGGAATTYVIALECFKGCREEDAIKILQVFYERGNAFAPDEKRKRPLKK